MSMKHWKSWPDSLGLTRFSASHSSQRGESLAWQHSSSFSGNSCTQEDREDLFVFFFFSFFFSFFSFFCLFFFRFSLVLFLSLAGNSCRFTLLPPPPPPPFFFFFFFFCPLLEIRVALVNGRGPFFFFFLLFLLLFCLFCYYFFVLCWKFWSPYYLGKVQHPQNQRCVFPSVCAVFSDKLYPQKNNGKLYGDNFTGYLCCCNRKSNYTYKKNSGKPYGDNFTGYICSCNRKPNYTHRRTGGNLSVTSLVTSV